MAAMGLFARVVHDAFGGAELQIGEQVVAAAVACCRCSLVPSRPLARPDIKRLMAYSSIAHMGYALMGLGRGHRVRRTRPC